MTRENPAPSLSAAASSAAAHSDTVATLPADDTAEVDATDTEGDVSEPDLNGPRLHPLVSLSLLYKLSPPPCVWWVLKELCLRPFWLASPSTSSLLSPASSVSNQRTKTAAASGQKSQPWRSHVTRTRPRGSSSFSLPRNFHRSRRTWSAFSPSMATHIAESSTARDTSCVSPATLTVVA